MDFFSSSINGRDASQAELERLYERIRLVGGKGSRRDARLCVMTFVALLVGERHTDAPATASPVIRKFAITLNDRMPDDERQHLKPFAPRIIGTRDALDRERVELLRTALHDEIAPQLRRDGIDPAGYRQLGLDLSAYGAGFTDDSHCLCGGYLDERRNAKRVAPQRVGAEVARLLVRCATEAAPCASRPWYWAKGIELLDRLCDVGNTDCGIAVGIDQLARAESMLDASRHLDGFSHLIASAIGELKHRLRHAPPKPAGGHGKPEPALHIGLHMH